MKKIIGLVLLSSFSFFAFAQGELKFEENTFDFGDIVEGDLATHVFKFKNIGNEPIIISRVKASCGCTTPYWPKNPIPPGGSGEIKASYNSKGRPGGFHKSITVTSNAQAPTKVLRINGNTNKVPTKVYTVAEISNSAHIKFVNETHNFGQIQLGQQVSKKMRIVNTGKSDLLVRNLKSNCNCVTFAMTKSPLKAGEETTLNLIYRPRTLGNQQENIQVYTNDITNMKDVKITIKANVVENASNKSIINNDDKFTF